MTPEELSLARYQLGPWLAGSLLDVLFQGILFCQLSRYVSWYREDKLTVKLVVLVLAILTSLKSIQSFALTWILFIKYFTDLQAAVQLSYTAWWESGNPLMVATISLYIQSFFCHRLFQLSRRWWIVVPLGVVSVLAFASACAATYFIRKGINATSETNLCFTIHLGSAFAGAAILVVLMSYFLMTATGGIRSQNASIFASIWDLIFLVTAPATLCAMFNLIFSQVWSNDKKFVGIAFNLALPKLYAISMMWNLNSRKRSGQPAPGPTFSSEFDSDGLRQTRRRPGTGTRGRRDTMELGAVKSMQIHTRTETTQQIDALEIFPHSAKDEDKEWKTGEPRVRYIDEI